MLLAAHKPGRTLSAPCSARSVRTGLRIPGGIAVQLRSYPHTNFVGPMGPQNSIALDTCAAGEGGGGAPGS